MERFWIYIDSKIQGPLDVPALRKVAGFTLLTQVCKEGEENWRVADDVIEIKSYFLAPPRVSQMPVEVGNTAVHVTPTPLPDPEVMTLEELPEKPGAMRGIAPMNEVETLPDEPREKTAGPAGKSRPSGGRIECGTCAYKNPRDIDTCMKCGNSLGEAALPEPSAAKPEGLEPLSLPTLGAAAPTPAPAPEPVEATAKPAASSTIEIPVTKILLGLVIAAVVGGGGYAVYRHKFAKKPHKKAVAVAKNVEEAEVVKPKAKAKPSSSKPTAKPNREYAKTLPGLAGAPKTAEAKPASASNSPAPYRVIEEAAPLRHRQSAPVDSAYAKKQRANQALWTEQEQKAVQLAQRKRIYGGQRTVGRNTEILMQILRDREYNTAFESGRRLYLYNDLDWSASQKDGPLYEVRLTFSGGREADGAPKKPLRFAFFVDIERNTVEPGGDDQTRANTMHAFFDESKIPPDDRRAIAKDTEELVLSAQPDASPLALDTVSRHFAVTYSSSALKRVATAYALSAVQKKLTHDTRLNEAPAMGALRPVTPTPVKAESAKAEELEIPSAVTAAKKVKLPASKGGEITYTLEKGMGRTRNVAAQAPSKATPSRLWEVMTSYDSMKQIVPDLLVSEREGQDGPAVIVHAVFLTRFTVFVFKTNLHLRVIERPEERTIEFERIAGEFESFRGSAQVVTDPTTHQSSIVVRASVAPTGKTPSWVMRSMAQRFLVPALEALRSRAEGQ